MPSTVEGFSDEKFIVSNFVDPLKTVQKWCRQIGSFQQPLYANGFAKNFTYFSLQHKCLMTTNSKLNSQVSKCLQDFVTEINFLMKNANFGNFLFVNLFSVFSNNWKITKNKYFQIQYYLLHLFYWFSWRYNYFNYNPESN